MLFHWSKYSKSTLVSLVIVVVNVVFNHCHEFFTAVEALTVIPFSLQDSPEAFHRTIVDALGNSGHALCHSDSFKLTVKCPASILVASVTVAKRRCSRICSYSLIERIEDEKIVIVVTNRVRDYPSVV